VGDVRKMDHFACWERHGGVEALWTHPYCMGRLV
jgi:hypothetical protein